MNERDKRIRAILDFMRSFNKSEGLEITTTAKVDNENLECIFDGNIECYISDDKNYDCYKISILWNGLNDTAMRALKMKGIYDTNRHFFEYIDNQLEIYDDENNIYVYLKGKENEQINS